MEPGTVEPVSTEDVAALRRFNRYFTRRIGALDDHYLGQDRPLGEARLLFEIAENRGRTSCASCAWRWGSTPDI